MVTNSSGFSASVRLEELDALTGLSLVAPVYRPSELRPVAIFNNITDRDANVELQLNYFVGGEWHDLPLPAITVRPHSAQHVDLGAQTRALPASATDIGLRISESSNRSGVLADVLLLDESGSQALQLFPKGYAGEIHPSHGFPFRISGSLETLITIANPSKTDEIEYSLHLFFDGGSYTYADHSLKPGEVRHIDVRALRDQQVPGLRNTFIPRTITSGQGKVHFRPKGRSSQSAVKVLASDHAHGADQGGIAGAITFDLVTKTSVTAVCVPVCSPGIYYIFGDPAEGVVGDVLQLQVYVVLYDFSVWQVYLSPVSWNGYNPSVTSPSEWQILLVGAGTSFMSYSLTVWVYGYGCVECEGGGQFCTGEGVVEIPIIGYFDVYVYGFFVGFSSLNTEVDDPDSYSLSVSVDVQYWLNSALTVQLGEVTLLEDTVGTGTYNVPIDVLALPAGEYYQVAAYLQNAQTAQAPVGQRPILSCGVGDDRTRLVNEYRNRDHQPTCGQFSDQPSTQSFPWSVIQSHGHNHPQYALVFYLLLNSLEALRSQYPIQITVNNRVFSCPVHNDTKSNARNSPHIYGDAADIASTQTNWQAIRDAAYIADPSWCAEPFSVQMNYNHVHLDYRFHQNSYFPRACPSGWTLP
jgi:hypothetical protein